mmetsp:Transcript_78925/g.218381  ORF Transcript_78925/g.218381 Transcript_78925/m.218381 type:complete len:265 (-) Transcript_78925:561-1355(-)
MTIAPTCCSNAAFSPSSSTTWPLSIPISVARRARCSRSSALPAPVRAISSSKAHTFSRPWATSSASRSFSSSTAATLSSSSWHSASSAALRSCRAVLSPSAAAAWSASLATSWRIRPRCSWSLAASPSAAASCRASSALPSRVALVSVTSLVLASPVPMSRPWSSAFSASRAASCAASSSLSPCAAMALPMSWWTSPCMTPRCLRSLAFSPSTLPIFASSSWVRFEAAAARRLVSSRLEARSSFSLSTRSCISSCVISRCSQAL